MQTVKYKYLRGQSAFTWNLKTWGLKKEYDLIICALLAKVSFKNMCVFWCIYKCFFSLVQWLHHFMWDFCLCFPRALTRRKQTALMDTTLILSGFTAPLKNPNMTNKNSNCHFSCSLKQGFLQFPSCLEYRAFCKMQFTVLTVFTAHAQSPPSVKQQGRPFQSTSGICPNTNIFAAWSDLYKPFLHFLEIPAKALHASDLTSENWLLLNNPGWPLWQEYCTGICAKILQSTL